MSNRGNGLLLSVGRLWLMSLPFRVGLRSTARGFRPGVKNIVAYEARRFRHRIYERERLSYYIDRMRGLIGLNRYRR